MAPREKGKQKDLSKSGGAASGAITGTPYDLCKAALEHFDTDSPVRYALRPLIRRALEAGAADEQQAEFSDAEWFGLAEAVFVTAMLLAHLDRSLETSAYEMVEPLSTAPAAPEKSAAPAASKGGGKKSAAAAAAQANGTPQQPAAEAREAFDWVYARQYILATRAGLTAAKEALEAHMAVRAETVKTAGKPVPRFMRLIERLGTSPKESAALLFLLHKQTLQADLGSLFSRKVAGGAAAISPAAYADMDTLELLEFLRPARKHVKEGLIPDLAKAMFQTSSDSYDYMYGGSSGASFSSNSLHLAGEVVKALMGETLTAEDLLKLDKTTMLEVLEEEEGFKAAHSFGEPGADAASTPKPALAAAEGLKAEGDLFELIKREQTRDATRKRSLSDVVGGDSAAKAAKKTKGAASPAAAAAAADEKDAASDREASPMTATAAAAGDTPAAAQADAAVAAGATDAAGTGEEGNGQDIREYRTDLEFLEDSFRLLITLLRVGKLKRVMALDETDQNALEEEGVFYDRSRRNPKARAAQQLRELEGRERLERSRIERRLHLTSLAGEWRPRLERLAEARGLAPFERQVLLLLVGYHVSPSVQRTFASTRSSFDEISGSAINVGALLLSFLPISLKEQISARRYFYKSGRLIKDGIITLSGTDFSRDIMDQGVDVDRRMLDFLVGLDTEFSDLVDGSHLYFPSSVHLDHVVLPTEQKSLIVETVQNFAAYRKVRKMLEPDGSAGSGGGGGGVVLLFHGPSGVGKTMMANAVAQHVHKKVLLINFPSLGSNEAGEAIRFIFREAKIHDALLFFDECESIFEDREKGSHHVNLMLTEVEKHDGIIIMATNRPHDLDEAMHRRITMAFEFRKPDHVQRQMIWRRQLPEKVQLEADVDINVLALKYELAGGYIRNAVQAALSRATARSSKTPGTGLTEAEAADVRLSQADLLHGAKLQLRGALRMKDFDRRRVPTRGLDDVLLPDELKSKLDQVVQHEKARAVLMGQWGFGQKGDLAGTVCLFSGPPGTGKTLAAEAIGFETGKPLKVVNCAGLVSKWVGETPKNIDALFQESRAMDAVLVFDECESLFGARSESVSSSSDRYASMDVGVLLHHLENHLGIVVLITNKPAGLDSAFQRRIRFELQFAMPPPSLRCKLWRLMLPKQAPLGTINWEQLGRSYELAGGSIKNAVVRAATRAALRMSEDGKTKITMEDLVAEAKEEAGKGDGAAPIGMYN